MMLIFSILLAFHLLMLPSFFCSSPALVFLYRRPHLFYRILQNILELRVNAFWYDWLLHHFGVVQYAILDYLYYQCSNFHLNRAICTYNLSYYQYFLFYILLHSSLRGHFENLNDLISDLGQRFQLLIRWLRLSWWLRLSKPLFPFCTLRRSRGG